MKNLAIRDNVLVKKIYNINFAFDFALINF